MSFSLQIQKLFGESLIVESDFKTDQRELRNAYFPERFLAHQGKNEQHHGRRHRSQIRAVQRILNRLDHRTSRTVVRMRAVMFRLQDWKRKNEQEERTGKYRQKTLGRKYFPNLRMILIHFAEKIVKRSSMSKRKAFFAFLSKKN